VATCPDTVTARALSFDDKLCQLAATLVAWPRTPDQVGSSVRNAGGAYGGPAPHYARLKNVDEELLQATDS